MIFDGIHTPVRKVKFSIIIRKKISNHACISRFFFYFFFNHCKTGINKEHHVCVKQISNIFSNSLLKSAKFLKKNREVVEWFEIFYEIVTKIWLFCWVWVTGSKVVCTPHQILFDLILILGWRCVEKPLENRKILCENQSLLKFVCLCDWGKPLSPCSILNPPPQ